METEEVMEAEVSVAAVLPGQVKIDKIFMRTNIIISLFVHSSTKNKIWDETQAIFVVLTLDPTCSLFVRFLYNNISESVSRQL